MAIESVAHQAAGQPLTGKMTFQEFLDWLDEDARAEWVDGEVIMATPASLEHQTITGFLYRLISAFVEARDAGIVVAGPFVVRLPLRPSGREPDLFYLTKESMARLRETYLDGAPDLVVEVVSPESVVRDRGEKFAEYEVAGVSEYWLIDPVRQQADLYVLTERKTYRAEMPDRDGWLHSLALSGFSLKPAWLWQKHLPAVSTCLAAIG